MHKADGAWNEFAVRTDRADVEALIRSVAGGGGPNAAGDEVPAVFPIRWLATPAVRSAIVGVSGLPPDAVVVHVSQRFAYNAPLAIDADYRLKVRLREAASDQATIEGMVLTPAGDLMATIVMGLRLLRGLAAP